MPIRIGTPELVILLIIILLLFGVGRISRVASELGHGIREFRRGLTETEEDEGSASDKSKDESTAQKT